MVNADEAFPGDHSLWNCPGDSGGLGLPIAEGKPGPLFDRLTEAGANRSEWTSWSRS